MLGNFLGDIGTWSMLDLITRVVGFMGALAMGYAVLLEAERRQDAVFVLASGSLFVYALLVDNPIFMFAMGLMFLISGRELIQIYRGKHKHSTADVESYRHPDGKNN